MIRRNNSPYGKERFESLVDSAISFSDFKLQNLRKGVNFDSDLELSRYVDLVIPEETWEQKIKDVQEYKVDVVTMGSDWEGNEKFEELRNYCDVVYLDRTEGISTTKIKKDLKVN